MLTGWLWIHSPDRHRGVDCSNRSLVLESTFSVVNERLLIPQVHQHKKGKITLTTAENSSGEVQKIDHAPTRLLVDRSTSSTFPPDPFLAFRHHSVDNWTLLKSTSFVRLSGARASFLETERKSTGVKKKASRDLGYRPISSQPFSAGCHGNRNWRPIWNVAWWARVSCGRSRMYGIQCKLVQFCPVIPYSTAFFVPEPVSCRGQRIARSNGKRNRSFPKNITTFAAVVEVLIAMFFLPFFLKYCNSKHLCAPHGARIHRPKYIWPTEYCQKKNGYHFMKNCNASTHQPAPRKICLTPIMCIDMHFHCIFSSTFNTTKHIFIDFVVLLHWTTQQNKSASLRFWLTWQFLKKKPGKVCQAQSSLHVVSCCPAFLLFVFLFFFHIIQTKKKEEKVQKQILEKNNQN